MRKSLIYSAALVLTIISFTACKKDDKPSATLKNEFIKRTVSPLIVGERLEIAYGAGSTNSVLSSMQVIANIPGAAGTGFETVTHRTVNAADITATVATSSITKDAVSTAMLIDTNATTLRYIYIVPEAARGKQVSFEFSVTSKNGEKAASSTPYYNVSKMSMARNITLTGTATGARYFSIADMKAYTQAQVDSGNLSARIDFVYAYAATVTPGSTAYTYGHSLVAPAAPAAYYPAGFNIPAGWTKNSTPMEKKSGTTVYDGQLKGDANNTIFVDDQDLQKQLFDGSPNFAITLAADASIFMKTADGKYTAFVYINTVNNGTSTSVISLKRYANN